MFDWTCPHCGSHQVVCDDNSHIINNVVRIGDSLYGDFGIRVIAIRCLNSNCNNIFLRILQVKTKRGYTNGPLELTNDVIQIWTLIPEGSAKPQPEYIPKPIRDDYYEACRIVELSPKASATLARRCLQGMIRDFCGITKKTLNEEIRELKRQIEDGTIPRGVSHDSVDAIDAIRAIGNIGAHMEKDIDMIIDVDPGEAQTLVDTIETLFDEWYVARKKREDKFAELKRIAQQKEAAKKLSPPNE